MTHELKVWKTFFDDIWTEKKKFEIRKNDRNFRVGDTLHLKEYDHQVGEYTGMSVMMIVTHVFGYSNGAGEFGLKPGYVIMSMEPLFPLKDEYKAL